ncbi:MAG: D-glycerate dehydrogenase [Kofleriaceae bacterium]
MVRVVSTTSLPDDVAVDLPGLDAPRDFVGINAVELSDADALICLLVDKIDQAVIARAPKLRVIANCAVGYDNVDVPAATRAGIAVTNTPDVLTEATAELAFALMLTAARRIPEGERVMRAGQWVGFRLDQLLGVELAQKTLGIVGMGRIGKAMARRAEAFGMIVRSAREPAKIDELFETSDVVSLHCPLTPETRHLVNAERLARMKPSAILVNTSRGGCVDEDALIAALHAGTIFAAALDVFANEPEIDRRLYDCPRLVLSPHIGSATTETRTAMARLCANAVIDVLAGRRPPNLVNKDVVIRG